MQTPVLKNQMTRVNIEIDSEVHKKAKLSAILQNKTLIQYINEAIAEKIKKSEKKDLK